MNETDIASRASDLRQRAICRLNGIEYKESRVTNPKPQPEAYELKNELWVRPNPDYQTLIVGLVACWVISDSYSLYVREAQRDYLLTATSSRCISGVTIQRTGGKYPAIYFTGAQGQKVASCVKSWCSYKDSHADVGKIAKICLSGDVVVSVETEGKQKVTRDSLILLLDNGIWWSKFWLSLGGIYLAAFAFRKREKWKKVIRSRLAST